MSKLFDATLNVLLDLWTDNWATCSALPDSVCSCLKLAHCANLRQRVSDVAILQSHISSNDFGTTLNPASSQLKLDC